MLDTDAKIYGTSRSQEYRFQVWPKARFFKSMTIYSLLKLGVNICCCCCCCQVASVGSDSVWPHRRQPTRLPRPWDPPGKNTGVGCHCLLQEDLPDPGIHPWSSVLTGGLFTIWATREAFAQVHVYCNCDAVQPSHPLTVSSAFDFSQHQGLFQWVISSHQMSKILELQL